MYQITKGGHYVGKKIPLKGIHRESVMHNDHLGGCSGAVLIDIDLNRQMGCHSAMYGNTKSDVLNKIWTTIDFTSSVTFFLFGSNPIAFSSIIRSAF